MTPIDWLAYRAAVLEKRQACDAAIAAIDACLALEPAATPTRRTRQQREKVHPSAAPKAPRHSNGRVTDDQVLGVITTRKGATATDVVQALNCSMSVAWARLTKLAEAGAITKGDDRKYRKVVAS